ncbi:conserved Plasmodium protein, unknown function [Plasmodium sp. gorilla clade G2]|uniref:conserved Plasmodium protein, unknown function n=1 Tax=Plasmodium sp. gorilla clade G2 TaxID=880535 RepID=UPI000D216371|nr:conserved Plasmodium protein, unknown function [Plasmodium sp. gorilla clade G2]SOV19972.1 conserved Plasmodium protein, unknown function [Plasmodium sp. gorilla clade G2]
MAEPSSTSNSLLASGLRSTVQTMAQLISESTPLSTQFGDVLNSSNSGSSLASSLLPASQVTPTQSSLSNSTGRGDDLVLVGAFRRLRTFLTQILQFGSSQLSNSDGVTPTESTVFSSATTNTLLEKAVSTVSDMAKGGNESSYINLLSGNSTLVPSNMTNSTCNLLENNGPRFETTLGVFLIMFCLLGIVWSMVCQKEGQHIKELICGKKKLKRTGVVPLSSLAKIEEEPTYENDNEDYDKNKKEKPDEEECVSIYENINIDEESDYDNVSSDRRRRRYHDENGNDEENISFVPKKKNDNEEEEVTYLNE